MAKSNITVPSRVYAPGSRQVAIPNLTTDDNGISVTLTRESWPAGSDIVSGVIEASDDGATWRELTRFSWDGGDQVNPRTGLPVTAQTLRVYWPERNDGSGSLVPQRPAQVRASITNTVSVQTAITLQGL